MNQNSYDYSDLQRVQQHISESRKCIQRIGQSAGGNKKNENVQFQTNSGDCEEYEQWSVKIEQQSKIIQDQQREIQTLRAHVQVLKGNSVPPTQLMNLPTVRELQIKLSDRDDQINQLQLKIDQYALQLKLREKQLHTHEKLLQAENKNDHDRAFSTVQIQNIIQPLCKTHMTSQEVKIMRDQVQQSIMKLLQTETNYQQTQISNLQATLRQYEATMQGKLTSKEREFEKETEMALEVINQNYMQQMGKLKQDIFELNELVRCKEYRINDLQEQLQKYSNIAQSTEQVSGIQRERIDQQRKELDLYKIQLRHKNVQSRELVKDLQDQINGKLKDMKRQNYELKRDHDQMLVHLDAKKDDRKVVNEKMDQIYGELNQLRTFMGNSATIKKRND